nr:A disintegrin and metalloproteinase with thrombospondin motifs 17-like isoform X1 [Lytechinus pictus]
MYWQISNHGDLTIMIGVQASRTMSKPASSTSAVLITFSLFLIGYIHCFPHVLSMKRGQSNSMKNKAKYKIPPPITGEIIAPRVVELMLVLHHDLSRYHGDDTINYITHISNQAADLWNDVTRLGVKIEIRITKTILLKDEKESLLPIEADAIHLLRKFCKDWQNNRRYRYGEEFDALILITREDLHVDNNYNATGLAYIHGACETGYECAVIEDTSPMGTAITIAHELGHLLGMYHDGEFNGCTDRMNIMSGYTVSGVQSVAWSTCSTKSLLEYLKLPRSRCLQNQTAKSSYPLTTSTIPGQSYDIDHQCQIALGRGAVACPMGKRENLCQHLKCLQPSKMKCVKTNRPPLDGTPCAINKWCYRGQCTDKQLRQKRQGPKLVAMETTTPMIGDTPSMKSTMASMLATKTRDRPKHL